MYFVSSTDKNILAFDYDSATGNVSNERVFWTLEGEGDPDGFAMDSEVREALLIEKLGLTRNRDLFGNVCMLKEEFLESLLMVRTRVR